MSKVKASTKMSAEPETRGSNLHAPIGGSSLTMTAESTNTNQMELVSILKKSSSATQQRKQVKVSSKSVNKKPQDGSANSRSSSQHQSMPKRPPKPRRRVATIAQRRAANIRERRRMFNLNAAFDRLRKKVPSFAYEKRLSRIETLKLAIMYIRFMDDLVNDDAYAEKYKQLLAIQQQQQQQQHNNSGNLCGSSNSNFFASASSNYLNIYRTTGRLSPAACEATSSNCPVRASKQELVDVCLESGCCSLLAQNNQTSTDNNQACSMPTYRSTRGLQVSPSLSSPSIVGAGSFTCCSSPASSSSNTTNCHSFTESPPNQSRSPNMQQQQQQQQQKSQAIIPEHQAAAETSYSYDHATQYQVPYDQFQDNNISISNQPMYYSCNVEHHQQPMKGAPAYYSDEQVSCPNQTKQFDEANLQFNQYSHHHHQQHPNEHANGTNTYSLHSLEAR